MNYLLLLLSTMAVSFGVVFWGGLLGFVLLWFGLFGCFVGAVFIITREFHEILIKMFKIFKDIIVNVKEDKND
jgi:hypothetical protein